mgnify:CR=1 FL=1
MNFYRFNNLQVFKGIPFNEIAECHKKAFPLSIYNIFGNFFLIKVFKWYLINPNKRHLIYLNKGKHVSGFLTMKMNDDSDSFFSYIFVNLILCIFKNPLIIFNKQMWRFFFKKSNKYRYNEVRIELVSIAVHPDSQGLGVGSKLIKRFEQIAVKHFTGKMMLSVRKENKIAIDFYIKNGWILEPKFNSDDYFLMKKGS